MKTDLQNNSAKNIQNILNRFCIGLLLTGIILQCMNKLNQPEAFIEITIEKSTNGDNADNPPGPNITTGSPVTWRYSITNSGEVDLLNIIVTDNVEDVEPVYKSGDDGNDMLDVGETWIYEATGVAKQGQYTNIGSVTAEDALGNDVSDIDYSHYYGIGTEYTVSIPPGKLPWPHHRPDMTQSEYYSLMQNLWIINNFGLYQATDDKSLYYFHSGLDLVLANGTKIYAVESGYVKSVDESSIKIANDETVGECSGYGWEYAHVSNPQFDVGDFVQKGDYIADVYFHGLQHLHLSRICRPAGCTWDDYWEIHYLYPDEYFIYTDTQPPVFQDSFFYFHNNSDEMFTSEDTTVVSGDVDIIVGIRDPGESAHSKYDGFGDRLCVASIEYEIHGEGKSVYMKSFDFTRIILIPVESFQDDRFFTVFKHHSIFHPTGMSWDKFFSYYIITNTDGTGEFGLIDTAASNFAWNTAALDGSVDPQFPNGLYTITVTAFDAHGNSSSVSDVVRVEN